MQVILGEDKLRKSTAHNAHKRVNETMSQRPSAPRPLLFVFDDFVLCFCFFSSGEGGLRSTPTTSPSSPKSCQIGKLP